MHQHIPGGRIAVCLGAFALWCAAPVPAQISDTRGFEPRVQKPVFGLDGNRQPSVPVVGDLTGDGLVDIVLSGRPVPGMEPVVLVNRGGFFEPSGRPVVALPAGGFQIGSLVVDVDRDGFADVVGSSSVTPTVLFGDGAGGFTQRATAGESGSNPVVGDFDGDGDPEFVTSTSNDIVLFEFVGRSFAPSRSLGIVARGAFLGAADLDGDGDLDLASSTGRFFTNDGAGNFTPLPQTIPSFGFVRVLLADLDSDGDVDFVSGSAEIWLNDGSATFTSLGRVAVPDQRRPVDLVDCDGDGDADLVLRPGAAGTTGLRYLTNDGSARFGGPARTTGFDDPRIDPVDAAFFDADGDGDVDAIPSFNGGELGFGLAVSDGMGNFEELGGPRIRPGDLAPGLPQIDGTPSLAADLDGDGAPDLVTTSGQILFNEGGDFVDRGVRIPGDLQAGGQAPVSGDFDGDGSVDLILASQLLLNDGAAGFTNATSTNLVPAVAFDELSAAADVDGDGALDLVAIDGAGQGRVYLNDGRGVLRQVLFGIPVRPRTSDRLLVVDLDGDGLPDVLSTTSGSGTTDVFVNAGGGFFALSPVPIPGVWEGAADVDGDGDEDLLAIDRLGLNDGSGNITVSTGRLPALPYVDATILPTDVDLDGDLDLWFAPRPTDRSFTLTLLINDGAGNFASGNARVDEPALVIRPRPAPVQAIGTDLDGDGDPDLILTPFPPTVLVNHHRQLTCPSSPALGANLAFDVYVEPGYAAPNRSTQLLLGTRPAQVVLPGLEDLGVLRIDPRTIVVTPPRLVPSGARGTRVVVPVPSAPSILGATLYAQALVAPSVGGIRLTNAVQETLR